MIALRKITILMLVLLAIITAATLLLGGMAPLLGIASGLLFLYYLALYFGIKFVGKTAGKPFIYGFSILLAIPIILLLIDAEALFEFLLQGVHIDMK